MAKTDISENIYRAIDTIVDARLQNINFNSTILCTIIDDSKASSGIYTVDNAGIKFQATSLDKSLRNNDQVYVTIPNNDFSAQKIILCKKDDFEEEVEGWRDPLNYLDIKYKFDDLGSGLNNFLIPQYSATPSEQSKLFTRVLLEKKLTYSNSSNSYTNFDQAATILANSGWDLFSSGSITIDSAPLVTILKRYLPGTQSNDYVIRSLDLEESQDALVPIGGGIPSLVPGTGYTYIDKQWQDAATNRDFLEPFSLWQDEKKYQPINLAGIKNIIISIDCKTSNHLINDYIISGDYGVYCLLFLSHSNKSESRRIQLNLLSAQDFLGDIYNFFDYYTQTVLFDVQNYQDYVLTKFEFYIYEKGNFRLQSGNQINTNLNDLDFEVKFRNPKIYFGIPKQENEKGYKTYQSYFQTSGKYYQKLDSNGVQKIYEMLDHIPAVDTELSSDGPFTTRIGAIEFQLTNDIIPKDNKYYYTSQNVQSRIPLPIPKENNPSALGWYEDVTQTDNGKRFLPKLYIKDSNNNYIESPGPKYYDDLDHFPRANARITTHDWYLNKYQWDILEQLWTLVDSNDESESYPLKQEYYVCFLPGRKIQGYFGGIETADESEPPKLGISSQEKNIDITLQTLLNNSNISISTKKEDSQIVINASNSSQICLNNDGIFCYYKKDKNNEIAFRLGYYNNNTSISSDDFLAINMAINNNGTWKQIHLSGNDLNNLADLLAHYTNIKNNQPW